ncbi:two-component system capsular synthesis response regulator RcsB [Oxalobacteraceae bacterium GrIS 1.11]
MLEKILCNMWRQHIPGHRANQIDRAYISKNMVKIKVILADDHPVVRMAIDELLQPLAEFDLVGVAHDSDGLLGLLKELSADVLVTDLSMPKGALDGRQLISYLKRHYPKLAIVVFTMSDHGSVLQELIKLGVSGIVLKVDDVEQLVCAIRAAHQGRYYWGEGVVSLVPPSQKVSALSPKELEVIRLFVSGKSVGQIATALSRSKQTVSSQKWSAMRKLAIQTEAELYKFAVESNLF